MHDGGFVSVREKMSLQKLPDIVFEKIIQKLRYQDRYAFVMAIQPSSALVYQYQLLTARNMPRFPNEPMICTLCFDDNLDVFLKTCLDIDPFFNYKEPVSWDDYHSGRLDFDEYLDQWADANSAHRLTKSRLSAFAPDIETLFFDREGQNRRRSIRPIRFDRIIVRSDVPGNIARHIIRPNQKPHAARSPRASSEQRDALSAYKKFYSDPKRKDKLVESFKDMPVFNGPLDLLKHLDCCHNNLKQNSRRSRVSRVIQALVDEKMCISSYAFLRRGRVTPGKAFDFNNIGMTFHGIRDHIENDTYMTLLQDMFLHGRRNFGAPPELTKLLAIRNYLRIFSFNMGHYQYSTDNLYQFVTREDNIHLGVYNTLRTLVTFLNEDFPY